jgi:phospholipase/carboxylesterase
MLLHGVGSNEQDLFEIAPLLDERFLILSARAPLTLASNSFAWFHVTFTPSGSLINAEEAEVARQIIIRFVEEAVDEYHADPNRVYLLGFSQGAIISLSVMLTKPEILAGIIAMSGRILPEVKPQVVSLEQLKDFPALVIHGVNDPILPIQNGRATRDFLSTLGIDLTYREYQMAHQVNEPSLADARSWLSLQLNKRG